MQRSRGWALWAICFGAFGCEASLRPAIGPTVDTTGQFGVELQAMFAIGGIGDYFRFQPSTGPGFGYNKPMGPYFAHPVELGFQFGGWYTDPLIRGGVGPLIVPRVSEDGVYSSAGGFADLLIGLTRAPSADDRRVLLGARFQGECICIRPELPDGTETPVFGLFSLSLELQWIFFHEPLAPVQQLREEQTGQ